MVAAFKEIIESVKKGDISGDQRRARKLAEDLGIVSSEAISTTLISEAEQDFMEQRARQFSNFFFTVTGLNAFTRFSRVFATGMGVRFLIRHAENIEPESARYLQDLGLTAEEVKAWDKGGRDMETEIGQKVGIALQRFVESSILKPNAAERPVWASDPRWALVWQLKSFFYAYGKTILGGIYNESMNKQAAARQRAEAAGREPTAGEQLQGLGAMATVLVLTTMPLAMFALELREYMKTGLAYVCLLYTSDAADE